MPVKIFCCYAHEDEPLLNKLKAHLASLQRQGLIEMWYDRDISAGADWEQEISQHLDEAQIILLLVSPAFMNSDYCYGFEMERALERRERGEAQVIPIILRPVYWQNAPFSKLQALPKDANPVISSKWHTEDEAFVDIVKGLQRIIQDFTSRDLGETRSFPILQRQENSYIGEQIGSYSIIKELGRGTYGTVYAARNILSKRVVAIKLMRPKFFSSQEMKESFLKEAQILRTLNYSYILPLIEVGFHEGFPYFVTEYAPNGSLRQFLKKSHPLPTEKVLTVLSQVGQALEFAHYHNIIHRDLKPENILLDAYNNALLADFGSATIMNNVDDQGSEIKGTLPYMAPEQFEGNASKLSDQYALGCIAYELFTGRAPFLGPDFLSMWVKHHYSPPPEPTPQLPPHIKWAIFKALEKNPSNRHADISAFISALYNERVLPQSSSEFYGTNEFLYSGVSGQIRRLPLYILLDCSRAMAGQPINAMAEGLEMIHRTLMADPMAVETIWINIIYYSDYVDQTGLFPISEFVPPKLVVGGARRAMGAALHVLIESIQKDLVLTTPSQHGDFRPLVFILTGGSSTDHYGYELNRLKSLQGNHKPTIIVLASRNDVDTTMLHEITDNVFLLREITPATFTGFFKWISGSIVTTSH